MSANVRKLTIAVTVIDDNSDEDDETFTVTISNASAGATIVDGVVRGIIEDDDDAPTVRIEGVTDTSTTRVTEGDSGDTTPIEFKVILSETGDRIYRVSYAVKAGGTATKDVDYSFADGTVTFEAGDSGAALTKTLTGQVVGDDLDEGAIEVFTVEFTSLGNAGTYQVNNVLGVLESANQEAFGHITDDDDPPTVSISAPAQAVTEGDSGPVNMVFTVNLSSASGRQVAMGYMVDSNASSAAAGTDFTALAAGTLTFAAGETTKTLTIAVIGDELDESDEVVVLKLTSPTNANIVTATASGTIADDDASPVLASLDDVALRLGQMVDITARATDADTSDTLTYAWTRKANEDAPAVPDGTNLNQARLNFEPPAAGTYTMTVTASDGNGNQDTGTVVITVTAASVVSVPLAVTVGEAAGNAEITVTTAAAFGKALTFRVSYDDVSATGAAGANGDYDNDAVNEVAFAASETTRKIVIPIASDTLDESNETFTVTIALADDNTLPAGFTLGNDATTVTITDDDTLSTDWTLSADPGTVAEGSGTTSIKVVATRSGTATATTPTTVSIAVAGGTAVAGTDFTEVSGFDLVVAVGAASGEATFSLAVTDDSVDESDETIAVSGSYSTDSITGTSITIADDDDEPELSIAAPAAVAEGDSGGSAMTFTVSLDAASGREVKVDYAVDSSSTASSATDFTGGSGTLTFDAGTTQKDITVTVRGDESDEGDETVVLRLSGAVNAGIATAATASGTITDDDASPVLASLDDVALRLGQMVDITARATDADTSDTLTYAWTRKANEDAPAVPDGTNLNQARLNFEPPAAGTYTMTVTASDGNGNQDTGTVVITVTAASVVSVPSALTIAESAGTAQVTVTVEAAFGGRVIFDVNYGGSATGAPSAADGDYGNALTKLTFETNDTEKTISIPIHDDNVDEGDESIEVTITVSGTLPAGFALGNTTTTVTVTDNDTAGVTVSPGSLAVTEGASGTYTVVLNTQPTESVTISVSGAGSKVSLSSESLVFGISNWGTAQTVTVTAGTDPDASDESATLTHASSGGGYDSVRIGSVKVSVTDKDKAGVTVSPLSLTVAEGGEVSYTVVLVTKPVGSVTVTPVSSAPAVAAVSGALTFTTGNWSVVQTVTVSGVQDENGADGTAEVSHTIAGYGSVDVSDVLVKVTDDDGVVVSESALTVVEGATATYTVVLKSQPSGSVTVAPKSGNENVATVSAALTFATGNWSTAQTVTVRGVDNAIDDDVGGMAQVSHAVSGYGTVATASRVEVTVTDDDTLSTDWTLSVSPNTVAESSSTTSVTVTATRSGTATAATSMTLSISVASDTATAGSDFDEVSDFGLSVLAGATSGKATFSLVVTDDSVDENDETISVKGRLAGNNFSNTTITVTDNDALPSLSITAPVATTEGDSGETAMAFTVALGAASGREVTVDYADDSSSTASAGTDFAGVAGTLTFAAGETQKTVSVAVKGDASDEEDETVVIKLSDAVNASISTATASGTITDDDASPVLAAIYPVSKRVGAGGFGRGPCNGR